MNEKKEKMKIICPYCGGEGKQYQKSWVKCIYPLLFLEPKYKCKSCKELFNESHKTGVPLKKKKCHLAGNILKAIIVIFFLWILYSFILTAT